MLATANAVIIELAGEPKGKGRPRFRVIQARSGKAFASAYTDASTRSYETLLREAAQGVMGDRPLLEGPLTVTVEARFSVPQSWSNRKKASALAGTVRPTGRPDLDNIVKVLDALNAVVWRDDSQIVEGNFSKVYADRPSLRIAVVPAALPLLNEMRAA
jgi:Holliday junction resolvase RusA-like endonuclease